MPNMNSRVLKFVEILLTAVFTAVATVMITHAAGILVPTVQTVKIANDELDFHVPRLINSLPPYIFTISYYATGTLEITKPKFSIFSEKKKYEGWYYKFKYSNLTKEQVAVAAVNIKAPGGCVVGVRVVSGKFALPDGTFIPIGGWHVFDKSKGEAAFFVHQLVSGRAYELELAMFTEERPQEDQIFVTIKTPEGNFSKLTPLQWEAIGWIENP